MPTRRHSSTLLRLPDRPERRLRVDDDDLGTSPLLLACSGRTSEHCPSWRSLEQARHLNPCSAASAEDPKVLSSAPDRTQPLVGSSVDSTNSVSSMATTFAPYDRPVRAAFIGLGRIYDLNVRAYLDNPDVEVVALVDPSEERRTQRQADWPGARTFASTAELAASDVEVDAVEALLPIPLHVEGVIELLNNGWHVNLQKPMCNDLESAQMMLKAAEANNRVLRVMENYIFYEPLRKLKETVASGELGEVSGYHLKMVGSARGGWDVPASSWAWQFQQMQRGRGILVFDDGWHKLST